MSHRIAIAALTVAVIGVASFAPAPGYAQTPEDSAKAKAAVQPASESAVAGAMAMPAAAGKVGKTSVDRTGDPSEGKAALAKPIAAATR